MLVHQVSFLIPAAVRSVVVLQLLHAVPMTDVLNTQTHATLKEVSVTSNLREQFDNK